MTAARRPSGNLIIGGQTFHVDAPVINWREPPYWDATLEYCVPTETEASPPCKPGGVPYETPATYGVVKPPYRRYAYRPALRSLYERGGHPNYEQTKAVIRQFVVHHDGCATADMCFSVLQNQRGNSVHFLLDNDGTIYQTCDLAIMAYHASDWNLASIGVELCNRGDALAEPTYYSKRGQSRDVKPCKINGHTIRSYDFTKAQYREFAKLCRALTRLLPNIPPEFPQASPGVQSWSTIARGVSDRFAGYIGHYHLTDQKWDPGPFDFKLFCAGLRGTSCYFLFPRDDAKRLASDRPVVPDKSDEVADDIKALYKANELRADGGFFPVGPWGESRLWHGGVHFAAKDKAPVFSPFAGRLVAARMGPPTSIGSVNFVLLKHDMALGSSRVPFYSLYMHLADELVEAAQPEWMTKPEAGWRQLGKPSTVVLLDEPIEAGALVGHVGRAGPGELSKPQVHVEFFSVKDLFTDVPQTPWKFVDGIAGGRFCESPEINAIIDTDHDGMLSRQELTSFYAGTSAPQLHFLVTYHVSEWTAEPSWSDALRVPKDFKKLKPAEIDALVAEQITPGLWWDARVAAHCKLPPDGAVNHYHPVAFLGWFHQQLLEAAAADNGASKQVDDKQAVVAKSVGLSDDREGTAMKSQGEAGEDPCNGKLGLTELANGFDTPECTP